MYTFWPPNQYHKAGAPAEGEIIIATDTNVMAQKSRGENICWIFRRPGCLDETL